MKELQLIKEQWQNFINGKEVNSSFIRPIIFRSWQRSKAFGVDPFLNPKSLLLAETELRDRLKKNKQLIETSLPFMNILYKSVEGSGFIIILVDKDGYLLKIIGDSDVIKEAEKNLLVPGANRSEAMAGTNAIGLALAENKPVQIVGPEHYNQLFHSWTCTAAPIHDSEGEIIGVFDLSGNYKLLHKHTLGMVVSVVEAIERELLLKKNNEEILLLNNMLVSIIESFPDGLIATDASGEIIHINSRVADILSIPKNDMKNYIKELSFQNHKLLEMFTSKKGYSEKEMVIKNNNNTKRYCLVSVNTIKSKDGQFLGNVVLLKKKSNVHKFVNKITGARAMFTFEDIKGKNTCLLAAIELAKKVASTDARIILQGESGTGKELFAQAIHNASNRSNGPFIAVNCGAIPRDLIESELFGYEEGAFTGALKGGKPGKFELADEGTIFLDEVSELPLEMQTKLLRVLQENQVVRVGGSEVIPLNVRVISATNKNLEQEVSQGRFRSDLLYRLNVITINIPPLRERIDDIPELALNFCRSISEKLSMPCPSISQEAMKLLIEYSWPGNVRELQNVIERAIILSDGKIIRPEHLTINEKKDYNSESFFLKPLDEIEKTAIRTVIKYTNGNISKASKILNLSRNTLYKKLKEINNM
jgi:transcriptional regulator of acetoin/glycerol metabolism